MEEELQGVYSQVQARKSSSTAAARKRLLTRYSVRCQGLADCLWSSLANAVYQMAVGSGGAASAQRNPHAGQERAVGQKHDRRLYSALAHSLGKA